MQKYKKGTKFKVCGHDELLLRGWKYNKISEWYSHKDFGSSFIVSDMLLKYEGQTLTVRSLNDTHTAKVWYFVNENSYFWPVGTFLIDIADVVSICDTCEEGATPIFGWFICKTCGDNLRTVK